MTPAKPIGSAAAWAWAAMLAGSDLPRIATESAGAAWNANAAALALAGLAGLATLAALARQPREIVAFAAMMFAYRGVWSFGLPALHGSEVWTAWMAEPNSNLRQVAVALAPMLAPAAMLAVAGAFRVGKFECRWGRWRRPVALGWPLRWRELFWGYNLFALGWLAVGAAAAFAPTPGGWPRVVALAPAIVAAAAVNALREELEYRVLPMLALTRLLGPAQTIALTSLLFGLAHWHGTPAGVWGVATTGLGGAMFAASILGTRGLGWAWLAHTLGDVLLFTGLVHRQGGFGIA